MFECVGRCTTRDGVRDVRFESRSLPRFLSQLEGVCGIGVVDLASLKLPVQGLNANAAFSSSYAPPGPPNAWICHRKSPPRPMSDVSPAPQSGIAEVTGEER